jgi:predicted DNA-binding transcriptional regulator AlpA
VVLDASGQRGRSHDLLEVREGIPRVRLDGQGRPSKPTTAFGQVPPVEPVPLEYLAGSFTSTAFASEGDKGKTTDRLLLNQWTSVVQQERRKVDHMNEPIVPELLTTEQAAELTGCGERTFWAWSRSGLAPRPIKIGLGTRPAVRYRRSELVQWIADGCPRCDGPAIRRERSAGGRSQ